MIRPSRLHAALALVLVAGALRGSAAAGQPLRPTLPVSPPAIQGLGGIPGQQGEADTVPDVPDDQGPVLLDGVAAVVGDEIVTYGQIEAIRQQQASQGRTLERGAILDNLVRRALMAQGGRTLIVDPSLVEQQIEDRWKHQVEAWGGAVAARDFLDRAGFTPTTLRDYWRDGLYERVWRDSVTGAGIGAGGRPTVDRYIRPGQYWAFYRILTKSSNPADLARVGARPSQVVIQQLVLPAAEYGGPEDTRALAQELRELATSGRSDFGDLVARYGAPGTRETRGLGAPISAADMEQLSVTRHRSRSLLDFVDGAQPGAVSEPFLGWKLGTDIQAIFVYKLVEKLAPREAKSHVDPEVQSGLEEDLLAQFDKVRVDLALQEAFESSYTWTAGQDRAQEAAPSP